MRLRKPSCWLCSTRRLTCACFRGTFWLQSQSTSARKLPRPGNHGDFAAPKFLNDFRAVFPSSAAEARQSQMRRRSPLLAALATGLVCLGWQK